MREEIAAAVVFMTRLIKLNENISKEKVEEFSNILSALLVEKFKNHWYQEAPTKGQGYRCIRIDPAEPTDPVLEKAAESCGLSYLDLNLPQELTLWVDPQEVCCRFGESDGSFCQLAVLKDGNLENQAHTINITDYLEQQQRRVVQNLNIVTTRTSANKLRAQAMKNAVNQYQYNSANYIQNKYQNNFYNNQQQLPSSSFSSHKPFHKHRKNGYHHNHGFNSSNSGYQGKKGVVYGNSGVDAESSNGFTPSFVGNSQQQGKDRFHWVNKSGKQSPVQNQVENMRLSPN